MCRDPWERLQQPTYYLDASRSWAQLPFLGCVLRLG